jgi:hypothetical protein
MRYHPAMCCFSGDVEHVSDTKIFARTAAGRRQVLIYEMTLSVGQPVAMVLPIPTPAGSPEAAVRFVSLEAYPDVFEDLEKAFPRPERSLSRAGSLPDAEDSLVVHEVGAFVASFVPSLDDFVRLDPRFRISTTLLECVPEYVGWGYAVFQLALPLGELARVHPMAFEFPTRYPDRLFFPTLHIHDRSLRPTAWFAHELYAQGKPQPSWESAASLKGLVDQRRAAELIHEDAPVWRTEIRDEQPNRDTWA